MAIVKLVVRADGRAQVIAVDRGWGEPPPDALRPCLEATFAAMTFSLPKNLAKVQVRYPLHARCAH